MKGGAFPNDHHNPCAGTYPDNFNLTDVNVYLNVPHSWVGDLSFSLDHAVTPTTIVNRPDLSLIHI